MIELILMVNLGILRAGAWPSAIAQPCVFPRVCAKQAPVLARYQPCVWPNPCRAPWTGAL